MKRERLEGDSIVAENDSLEDETCETVNLKRIMERRVEFPHVERFYKQQPALDYMHEKRGGAIFSYENEKGKGKRGYCEGGWRMFFNQYRNMRASDRYYYEVLLPGELPNEEGFCHFYTDVDFGRDCNQGVDFITIYKELHDMFMDFIREHIPRLLNIPFSDVEPMVLMELDSSNERKFSRHVLLKFHRTMFHSPAHVGALLRCFEQTIIQRYGPPDVNKYYVWSSEEKKQEAIAKKAEINLKSFLFDVSVYTRYRTFRLWRSIKRGQTGREFVMHGKVNKEMKDVTLDEFLNTLVQYSFDDVVRVIRSYEPDGVPAMYTSTQFQRKFYVPGNRPKVDLKISASGNSASMEVPLKSRNGEDLDDAIVEAGRLILSSQPQSDTAQYTWFYETSLTAMYQSTNLDANPCPFIGRPHKGNHIRYHLQIVDTFGSMKVMWSIGCSDVQSCAKKRTPKKLLSMLPRTTPEAVARVESLLTKFVENRVKLVKVGRADFDFLVC